MHGDYSIQLLQSHGVGVRARVNEIYVGIEIRQSEIIIFILQFDICFCTINFLKAKNKTANQSLNGRLNYAHTIEKRITIESHRRDAGIKRISVSQSCIGLRRSYCIKTTQIQGLRIVSRTIWATLC